MQCKGSRHSSFIYKNVSAQGTAEVCSEELLNFKVILLGNINAGKTSILNRLIHKEYNQDYKCTTGMQQKTVNLSINGQKLHFQIWDTCGEEKFRSITRQFYRDKDAAIVIFDLSDFKGINNIKAWIDDIKDNGDIYTKILIVGNKYDLAEKQRDIDEDEIRQHIREMDADLLYIECSAKINYNIDEILPNLSKVLVHRIKREVTHKDTMCSKHSSTMISLTKSSLPKFKPKDKAKCCN